MTRHQSRLVPAVNVFLASAVLALSSCMFIGAPYVGQGKDAPQSSGSGAQSLTVTIEEQVSRTLLPGISMTPASYVVTGRGPSGASFVRTTTTGSVEVTDLQVGPWAVTVEAQNSDGTVIGRGTANVALQASQSASADVTILPLSGYGTLSLQLNWPAADVANPVIVAQLIPAAGAARNLTFNLSTGRADSSTANIPTGYHTLSLQLLDGTVVVAGAIEVVRIVKDQSTAGAFTFDQIDPASATMQLNFTPQLSDPLTVTLTGQVPSVVQRSGFNVQASVPGVSGNVVYTWYLNGEFQTTGSSFAVPADLLPGTYRIDVTAFAADGSQAGSTNYTFTVLSATQVTLLWDPNTDPGLAGYKLYWGAASGVYDHMIDVGNATSYTVTGLQPGGTYYFVVTAYNTSGTESGYSNEVSFTN